MTCMWEEKEWHSTVPLGEDIIITKLILLVKERSILVVQYLPIILQYWWYYMGENVCT